MKFTIVRHGETEANQRAVLQRALREEGGALVMPGSSVRVKMWWEKQI